MSSHHVVPIRTYLIVSALLFVLLFLTVAVTRFELGAFGTLVAMSIAVAKMLLIILYFMHVKYHTSLIRVFVFSGFFWLAIMVGLTLSDYLTR